MVRNVFAGPAEHADLVVVAAYSSASEEARWCSGNKRLSAHVILDIKEKLRAYEDDRSVTAYLISKRCGMRIELWFKYWYGKIKKKVPICFMDNQFGIDEKKKNGGWLEYYNEHTSPIYAAAVYTSSISVI